MNATYADNQRKSCSFCYGVTTAV